MNTNTVAQTDVQEINNAVDVLLPFLPTQLVHIVAGLTLLLVPMMVLGRVWIGLRQSGVWGAVTGVLLGTNVPQPLADCPFMTGPKKSSVPVVLALLSLSAILLGCAHVSTHQTTRTDRWMNTNGIPIETTYRTIDAGGWTLFDASDAVAQYAAAQSATNQSCSVGSVNQSSSATNLAAIISAVVQGVMTASPLLTPAATPAMIRTQPP